jgi:hypothetical protein
MFHFFGLGTEYKLGLHEEIFSLCYYGKGGFIWDDVYSLPIHLRRFYIQQVTKAIETKNKAESSEYSKAKRTVPTFSPPTKR